MSLKWKFSVYTFTSKVFFFYFQINSVYLVLNINFMLNFRIKNLDEKKKNKNKIKIPITMFNKLCLRLMMNVAFKFVVVIMKRPSSA